MARSLGQFHQKGGPDIPVLDGGTGASVDSTARTNLGVTVFDSTTHNALDHIAGPLNLLDETAHDVLSHAGLTGVGRLLQVPLETVQTADLCTTAQHQLNDTTVIVTETAEAAQITYTPTISGSTTFIRATIHLGDSGVAGVGAGLWLGVESVTRSWATTRIFDSSTIKSFEVYYRFTHSNTDPQTWRVRYSANNAGTSFVNRSGNGAKYSNSLRTTLEIREIQE